MAGRLEKEEVAEQRGRLQSGQMGGSAWEGVELLSQTP